MIIQLPGGGAPGTKVVTRSLLPVAGIIHLVKSTVHFIFAGSFAVTQLYWS